MKVLLAGISGALARRVTHYLLECGHTVIGLDRRPWPDPPAGVTVYRHDVRKRPAEDVFRTERPEAVIHMATVTHFSARREERYRINLHGTRAIFERAHEFGVKRCVFVGRHTIYGAAPDAPLYRKEDEPPLGMATFPELADMAAADLYAGSALWRYPEVRTAVLRLVYTLGPSRRGTLAGYLNGKRVPTVLGFDPLFQFMHEEDAARAIAEALDHDLNGIYNVTGPQPVPLSLLCRATGRPAVPLPEPLFPKLVGKLGLSWLPRGALAHIKYPIVVDGAAFAQATGFKARYDEVNTMEAYRWA
ncbi:MAG: NAD-dependent epimerase/dehydratase family protein [Myxococcales bacterium]|nr:NAD-dependent epimerase/dehydratase family protein [Myxococcales bacterium]MCB9524951.1 NAD-dependent epimerase/dehydratase family protein [Myxococcales bacterium]